ncbi:MAG TPA: PKD domain-containing protein [Chitinophagaceae bacterium]|jgi:gliding motility-associated-like protein|nr:PKD domain-containing protein [Chitinophagaceae bacterium]
MNRFAFTLLFTLISLAGFASHIVGGEMIYEYLRPGAGSTKVYRITLRLFRDDDCAGNCAGMPTEVFIGIFDNGTRQPVRISGRNYAIVTRNDLGPVNEAELPFCIQNPPDLNYSMGLFTFEVTLPNNVQGYTAMYQTCCRISPLRNVINNVGGGSTTGGTGSGYSCNIPGSATLDAAENNHSPRFNSVVSVICAGKDFTLDFSAADSNGDSLVYSFAPAFDGGFAKSSENIEPTPPPYQSVPYVPGHFSSQPLGNQVTINSRTGVITGVAPERGRYVVCVVVQEYRQGKAISYHRKDFIINVDDCEFAGAKIDPEMFSCDDKSYDFRNQISSSLNKTYFWDFGDPTTDADTANSASATYEYRPDSGTFRVTVIVNRGEPCGDTAYGIIRVYPGFVPAFEYENICITKPTQFRDRTTSRYGTVDSWRWDFGVAAIDEDVSEAQHPIYQYPAIGTYQPRLIVTNTKGCIDTATAPSISIIDRPPLTLAFRDTLICSIDSLQLRAEGPGTFSWTPAYNILNAGTGTPTVFPKRTTMYHVQLAMDGCISTDSAQVRVVDNVTLSAFPSDTLICATDGLRLRAQGDGLQYQWTASTPAEIEDATAPNTLARVVNTTLFTVRATIGKCFAEDVVRVRTSPYPSVRISPDTTICYNTPAQLHAEVDGARFIWSPSAGMDNPQSLHPRLAPMTRSQTYVLTAWREQGNPNVCPKPAFDTITVTVRGPMQVSAGNDTAVVVGQPLQLRATGGEFYRWTPATDLSDDEIPNPVGMYNGSYDSITYTVRISDIFTCTDSARVKVRIFKTQPSVFVPTGFTPNGDSRNDRFYPIAVGMSRIEYFRVYNRWGELVFSTTVNGHGWDGRINGKDQGSGTFVWLVKAVDYLGKPYFSKGTVTLIR